MGMFDSQEFARNNPASMFESLREALTLNQLMNDKDYQGAAAFLRTCDPKLVAALFEKARKCWDEFIRKMTELDTLLQAFDINHHADMVTLKDAIRPDLIAFARQLETHSKRGERLDGIAADMSARALSQEEAQRVQDLLGKSGLSDLIALFGNEETEDSDENGE